MMVRKLRLERAWSQEQLAEMSGLSVRTIQRIERGQTAGLESLKALAAVFDVHVTDLQQDKTMSTEQAQAQHEEAVVNYVRDIKGFYSHLTQYVVIIGLLFVVNIVTGPEYMWAWWPALGWGIGVLNHALHVFEIFSLFGPKWEKRQIEKRLNREEKH